MSDFWKKVGKTLRHHGQQALRGLRGLWWDIAQPEPDRPIFVIGCSRAGTTVLYKTLAASPELGSLNRETHDFWVSLHPLAGKNWGTHALSEKDASPRDRVAVARYFFTWTGKPRWVDKNNQNGLCVPYLQALFPEAIFVYIKRNPGDNINSLIEGWGKEGKFSTWSDDLPAQVAIDNGRYTRWCFFLSEGWRRYLKAPVEKVAAFQYCAMNEAIMAARAAVPPSNWVEVFYEDLVRDPVAGFRAIFQSSHLQFDARMEDLCRNVLETPYDAFGEIRLDKWRDGRNRERVERVLPLAQATAVKMGYPG
ncbi:MAG: sulfotransferase family protein [Nitrosomonadales bacterium]|nr:MAG: sulfotransferase family protein [Nitrosomonadales bacterium]